MKRKHNHKRYECGYSDSNFWSRESDSLDEIKNLGAALADAEPYREAYYFDRYPTEKNAGYLYVYVGDKWKRRLHKPEAVK